MPEHSFEEQMEYMSAPFAHKSDSFYFVDDKLIMHNKAGKCRHGLITSPS